MVNHKQVLLFNKSAGCIFILLLAGQNMQDNNNGIPDLSGSFHCIEGFCCLNSINPFILNTFEIVSQVQVIFSSDYSEFMQHFNIYSTENQYVPEPIIMIFLLSESPIILISLMAFISFPLSVITDPLLYGI